ncbi:hypothetical protein FisN_26Hu154 [Fistulifera solaris]|uniref:Uncharacterized protein n=1 Tax=Fistulifera solaris TaxID=1519565 RepID=A0A1Z5JYA9_FISSO|nr:hypothetical protein FisN_26Hu154 [Fistulifera solaris]|eukprot:GAX18852.1 hypothetical protein FisN_26Hu154 [Fistulifera solaris]
MTDSSADPSLLFGVIPNFLRKREQEPCWSQSGNELTFTLLRTPKNLQELNQYNHQIAIWRENETLTYVVPHGVDAWPSRIGRGLVFQFDTIGLQLYNAGKTDEAIAESAAFFLGLVQPTDKCCSLTAYSRRNMLDLSAAGPQCFSQFFEACSSSSTIDFQDIALSAEQSAVIAARPRATSIVLQDCTFSDQGTAFVSVLETRQSSFGSLNFPFTNALNENNLQRLFQIDAIEHLEIPLREASDDITRQFLAAKTNSLDFCLSAASLDTALTGDIDIKAEKLFIMIIDPAQHDTKLFAAEPVIAFLRRLADLRHLRELHISFKTWETVDLSKRIVEELIRVVLANESLEVLDLCVDEGRLDWDWHISTLLTGLRDHKGLRIVKLDVKDKELAFGPNFDRLRQLLSHNRNVVVMNFDDQIFTNGLMINAHYSLNRFYRGSVGLVAEPPSERLSLVATALLKNSRNDLQRSALLLSDHLDLLCESVQYSLVDADVDLGAYALKPSRQGRKRTRSLG